jgi:tellurite resistance protein TerC
MTEPLWLWVGFNVFILAMLALDLGVFHRKTHVVSVRESLTWTAVWVGLALVFNAGVWYYAGSGKALEFFTGYLIEKSLSVDNVFVFALLFSYFAVPPKYQHKVLFWGILGALIMRAIMIAAGAALITKFSWIIYLFGAFLILTGIKMIVKREEEIHPERNPVVRWFKQLMPVTPEYRGDKFFVREVPRSAGGPPAGLEKRGAPGLADGPSAFRAGRGVLMATPLFVVLLLVEFTDLIFAVDSIPAIFAVTKDPFIVYTSNVFAILGLRSLYFALAGVMDKFHYLKIGLGVVLAFVGVKMLLAHSAWKIDTLVSLGVIVVILTVSVVWSLMRPKKVKLPVAADVSPLHLNPGKAEPTHVGCYKETAARTE